MQRKSRGVLLALVAVFAMSAVTAAAASATTPEFKPVPAKKKFTAKSGTVYTEWDATTMTCAKSATTGEITGARTVGNVVIVYTGCEANHEGAACPVASEGAKTGEIVTKALNGELGTTKVGDKVGLRLKPATKTTWFRFAEGGGRCFGPEALYGSAAGEISLAKGVEHKLTFLSSGGEEQIGEITLDSGELEKPLLTVEDSIFSMTIGDTLTFEEAVEVT
jgi:hypothetical protein